MYNMAASSENPSFTPVLQVIHLKKIDNKSGGEERWKVVLSDGNLFCSGMCATQLNHLVHSGTIALNCILRVSEFIVNVMGSGQRICIVLGVEQAGPNPGNRLGDPADIAKAGNLNGPPSQQPKPQPMYGKLNGGNPYGGGLNNGGGNPYGQSGGNQYGGNNRGGSGPTIRTSTNGQPITPIAGLNMYSNRWVIRAKVKNKSGVRTWSNAKGEGTLFSIELLDSSGTDVKATFFKEAVDKFFDFIEEDRVYTFSGGRLKVANMQWNRCKSQFEITFDQNSEIHLDQGGQDDIRDSYEFVRIADIEQSQPGDHVDILGVVKNVGEIATILSKKSGKELTKCELTVEDDSGADITVTMWGDTAQNAQSKFSGNPLVAFKRARVSDWGGRTLSGDGFSINPNIPEAQNLSKWWQANDGKSPTRSLSSGGGNRGPDPFDMRKTVNSIKSEQLGYNEKPDYISFKATITFLKKDKQGDEGAWYTACSESGDPCKNMYKATQTSDGNWHCDKCQKTLPDCVRRFIFSGTVADDTSTTWVSVFNEQAEKLFEGAKADDLYQKIIDGDTGRQIYESTFAKATYTEWIFKCKVKQEMVGDEQRIKTSLVAANPIDYAAESRNLLQALSV